MVQEDTGAYSSHGAGRHGCVLDLAITDGKKVVLGYVVTQSDNVRASRVQATIN